MSASAPITLIDYDAGNLASLEGALDRLGFRHARAASKWPTPGRMMGPLAAA